MLKREILLTGCAIVLALSGHETLAAEACTTVPTCAELGYTKTSCDEGFASLKCPFDKTKLFCNSVCKANEIYGQISKKCGTKNPDLVYSGETIIGVAINDHLAVAMKDEVHMDWDTANTTCNSKTTGGKSWRLPTADELMDMYAIQSIWFGTFYANGGIPLSNNSYWSSTNGASSCSLGGKAVPCKIVVNPNTGAVAVNVPRQSSYNVRCVFDL